MQTNIWEDFISLRSGEIPSFEVLEPAAKFREADTHTDWSKEGLDIDGALQRDTFPLPVTADREAYYGNHHFSYWASGLRDMRNLLECCGRLGLVPRDYYDLGCASGRVIRHFATNREDIKVFASDINRRHVEWVLRYLPTSITCFQTHSIPAIPLPDSSIDLVSAFSVFTHIEAFETTWLMELRRILRPGGLAWITLHTEKTWEEMQPSWPLYQGLQKYPDFDAAKLKEPMPGDRMVFRLRSERSYSSLVFYATDYVRRTWSRFFEVVELHRRLPGFQDVVVLRKS